MQFKSLKIVAFATALTATQIAAQKIYTDSTADLYSFIDALSTTAPANYGSRLLAEDAEMLGEGRNLQGTPVSQIVKCDFPGMCPDGTYKDSC